MKLKQIQALESYFKTDDENWNEHTFKMLCEILQKEQFANPELPLKLFSSAIELFKNHNDQPLKAVQLFTAKVDKHRLTQIQRLFVYEWVCSFLEEYEFECIDLSPIKDLLNIQREKLEANCQPVKLLPNILESLRELINKELETLPERLKELETVRRLNIVCKIMPFVVPKCERVNHE